MNTKLILPCFFSVLFLICVPCRAQQAPDEIWVAVTFTDKGADQPGSEYYGSLDRKTFNTILNAAAPTGFIKLNHVAQMGGGGRIVPLSEEHGDKGVKQGYSRVMYFRVESIVRIIELDDQFVKDNSFDLNEKK